MNELLDVVTPAYEYQAGQSMTRRVGQSLVSMNRNNWGVRPCSRFEKGPAQQPAPSDFALLRQRPYNRSESRNSLIMELVHHLTPDFILDNKSYN